MFWALLSKKAGSSHTNKGFSGSKSKKTSKVKLVLVWQAIFGTILCKSKGVREGEEKSKRIRINEQKEFICFIRGNGKSHSGINCHEMETNRGNLK